MYWMTFIAMVTTLNSIDDRLAAVSDAINMKQYVHGPRRENCLLDVLACSDDRLIRDVTIDDAGNVSSWAWR